jgi:hypothetical protein
VSATVSLARGGRSVCNSPGQPGARCARRACSSRYRRKSTERSFWCRTPSPPRSGGVPSVEHSSTRAMIMSQRCGAGDVVVSPKPYPTASIVRRSVSPTRHRHHLGADAGSNLKRFNPRSTFAQDRRVVGTAESCPVVRSSVTAGTGSGSENRPSSARSVGRPVGSTTQHDASSAIPFGSVK